MSEKLLVIGNFGTNGGNCGQSIKTNVVYDLLKKESSVDIVAFDTATIKHPMQIFALIYNIFRHKKFIVLPAQNALPVLAFLFFIFHKKADYIVIGGWLPSYLAQSNKLLKFLIVKQFRMFVETHEMSTLLANIGINSKVLPNFKKFEALEYTSAIKKRTDTENSIKFVYLSRIIKAKGVLDALCALKLIAAEYPGKNYNFHIYGNIAIDFEDEFLRHVAISQLENLHVTCKGFIQPNEVQDTLTQYHYFLFPTYYPGEGFPGCVVDAFSAGLPVIASDWKYNAEVVKPPTNGFLYETKNVAELTQLLRKVSVLTPQEYCVLVNNCLASALQYHEDHVKIDMRKFGIIC